MRDRTKQRNLKIKADYKRMTGERHLDSDFVLGELEKKYHLAPITLWRIVSSKGRYKKA